MEWQGSGMEGWALQQLKEEGWEWRQRENEKETRRNSRHSRWSGSEGKRSDGHHCNSRQSMEESSSFCRRTGSMESHEHVLHLHESIQLSGWLVSAR
jgi:hypothetical protein